MLWQALLVATVVLVLGREVFGFVLAFRRDRAFDAQYDLRYFWHTEPIEDDYTRSITIDWLALMMVDESRASTHSSARVFTVRRFSAAEWEFRETDQSWAEWVGDMRSSSTSDFQHRLTGEDASREPTWRAFHPERAKELEDAYCAFLDGFEINGPCGSAERLTRTLFDARHGRRRLEAREKSPRPIGEALVGRAS